MRMPKFLQIAALILLAAGAQPAFSSVWQWSHTASTNAGADPTINWAEGMSPSSVNDSARAMMARTADYRDDISGSLVTAGSSTAYTLSSNQLASGNGIASPATDGQMIAFRAHATNGVAPTLNVDGGTAYPLQSAAGVAIGAGTIVVGTPYRASFNLSSLAWVLEAGYGNPYSIPLGGLLYSTGPTPPNSNFVLPAGQCISTTTYATYWVQQGSPASGACAGGQFAIIDLRATLMVALDNLNGTPANRLTSAANGCGTAMTSVGAKCANGNESTTLVTLNLPAYTPAGSLSVTTNNPNVVTSSGSVSSAVGGGAVGALSSPGSTLIQAVSSSGTLSGTAQGGASQPFSRVMHTTGVNLFLRVI